MHRRNLLTLGAGLVACAGGVELFRRSIPTPPPPLPSRTVRIEDRGEGLRATATVEEMTYGFGFDPDGGARWQRLDVRTRGGDQRELWFRMRSPDGTAGTPVDGVRSGYLRIPVVVGNPETDLLSSSIRDGKAGTVEVPLAGTAFEAGSDGRTDVEGCSRTVPVLTTHGYGTEVQARVSPDLFDLDFEHLTDDHPPYPADRCGTAPGADS